MRYIISAALIILVLSIPALSVLESQKCGPYLVSFNLTTNERLNVSQLKPIYYNKNVQYGLRLSNQNGDECGLIGICTFYQPAPSYVSLDHLASFVESSYKNLSYQNLARNQRTIDGRSGFLVTGTDSSGHLKWIVGYWIIDGSTEVEMQGNCSWEMKDVTAILDSVHIERTGF